MPLRSSRVPARTAVVALLALVAALLVAPSASANVPQAPRSFTSTIEPPTPYVAQVSCDPKLRRGVAKLGAWLTRTWPGTTWSGPRACDGTVSEHEDGRAIDWMVASTTPQGRADGRQFITWVLATDSFGNTTAMARRLGVMYLIFNGYIWGSWNDRWVEYDDCHHKKKLAHAYDNACHRTHMHISLSWNGARGLTTFWTGRVYPTDYGPCRPKGKKYAPVWTHRNLTPCPGTWG